MSVSQCEKIEGEQKHKWMEGRDPSLFPFSLSCVFLTLTDLTPDQPIHADHKSHRNGCGKNCLPKTPSSFLLYPRFFWVVESIAFPRNTVSF